MKDIFQLAKSLNDDDLSKLVDKLKALLDKRKQAAIEKEKKNAELKLATESAIQEINDILASKGVTLSQLGLKLDTASDAPVKTERKTSIIKAENQTYIIVDGKPQLVFSITAGKHRKAGTAVSFSDLSADQQVIAKAAVDERNNARGS
jgi:hypothetical protein